MIFESLMYLGYVVGFLSVHTVYQSDKRCFIFKDKLKGVCYETDSGCCGNGEGCDTNCL